jgi:hypothetical protein
MSEMRKKIWIDKFQTHLFWLFVLYAIMYQAVAIGLLLCWQMMGRLFQLVFGEEASLGLYIACPAALTMLSLIFIYDSVKYLHRIVGPLYRFRQTLKAVQSGEPVALVELRKGDYLGEMKDELNDVLKLLEQRGMIEIKKPGANSEQKSDQPVQV